MTIEQLIYKLNQASPDTWSYQTLTEEDGVYYLMINGTGPEHIAFQTTIHDMDINSFEAMNYIRMILTYYS